MRVINFLGLGQTNKTRQVFANACVVMAQHVLILIACLWYLTTVEFADAYDAKAGCSGTKTGWTPLSPRNHCGRLLVIAAKSAQWHAVGVW